MAEVSFYNGLKTLELRARYVAWFAWTTMALCAAMALFEFAHVAGLIALNDYSAGNAAFVYGILALTYLLVFLASIVFVGMWIHRAHANLFAAGIDGLQFTPGWSVGWFFVPVANLFKPFKAMRELWNASHNLKDNFGEESPESLKIWWGTYLAGNILGSIATRLQLSAGPDAASVVSMVNGISNVLTVVCAWYLLQIVREVVTAQQSSLTAVEAFA